MCLEISCSPDELQKKLNEFMRAYNATPHKLGPTELVDSAIGRYFAAGFGCEVTAFADE
jgi:hypothetical protein